MPEIPDLEGYAAYFNKRLPGLKIEAAERGPVPWLVREQPDRWEGRLPGQTFGEVYRHAKMLFFPLVGGDNIAVHAMLTGRYQYAEPGESALHHRRPSRSTTACSSAITTSAEWAALTSPARRSSPGRSPLTEMG
jgi:formamidopyrimidine-DNA glycosylase